MEILLTLILKNRVCFASAHLTINNATINENFVNFNMTIFFMDIVDVSNEQTRNYFLGNDNLHDILNTQLALARMMRVLQKSNLYTDKFELINAATWEGIY